MRERYLIIGFIILLVILFAGGGGLFSAKLSARQVLADWADFLSPSSALKEQIAQLKQENENLKAAIFLEQITPKTGAVVYSSYPFNNRSEIVIGAGSVQGLKEKDIVTHGPNILVGQVKKVFPETSIVTTIFDPSFETAVRVGPGTVDALMRGGNELTLELIPLDAVIEPEDLVVTAGADFPYGLEIGRVRKVEIDRGGVFKTAAIDAGFEIRLLKNVDIRS